jgi:hypothetical protein
MIKGINIDLTPLFAEFNVQPQESNELVKTVIRHITRRFHEAWSRTAEQELSSSRKRYVESLQIHDEGGNSMSVVLHGSFPNMIESGCTAFDMKEGFAKSLKAKKTKDGGWYLTIPFRFGTPGSIGESFSGIMPEEVYREAKKLKGSITKDVMVDGNIVSDNQWGGKLKSLDLPEQYQQKFTRPAFSSLGNADINAKSEEAYEHKSNIYEGMVHNEKTYEKATQSTYNTFRRVSSNSAANSWIHQGIDARNIAEKALGKFDLEAETNVAVDKILTKLGY